MLIRQRYIRISANGHDRVRARAITLKHLAVFDKTPNIELPRQITSALW